MKKGNRSLKLDKTEELELLLDLNPPNQLKESVNYVFLSTLNELKEMIFQIILRKSVLI